MKMYFYSNGKDKEGPLTIDELKRIGINPKTLIWCEGLDDWKEAESLSELREILELTPPPILIENDKINLSNDKLPIDKNTQAESHSNHKGSKEASQGWIFAGYILSLLGGYLGIVIGLNYIFGNYKKEVKLAGWIMTILGIISATLWKSIK